MIGWETDARAPSDFIKESEGCGPGCHGVASRAPDKLKVSEHIYGPGLGHRSSVGYLLSTKAAKAILHYAFLEHNGSMMEADRLIENALKYGLHWYEPPFVGQNHRFHSSYGVARVSSNSSTPAHAANATHTLAFPVDGDDIVPEAISTSAARVTATWNKSTMVDVQKAD